MKKSVFVLALCLLLTACGTEIIEEGYPALVESTAPPTVTTTETTTTEEPTTTTTTVTTTTTTTRKPTTTTAPTAPPTSAPAADTVSFAVSDPENTRGLDTTRNGFGFGYATEGVAHSITQNNQARFDGYGCNALAWDNKTTEKVLYLTFDCGYAYGDLVEQILDTLKEKQVPSAFFCTMQYLKSDPDMIQRMIDEGHIVGNHSVTHPDCTTLTRPQLAAELEGVHNHLLRNFGYEGKYFRFPTGAYSHNAVDAVHSVGYRSVFWSIAHADWDPANQPGVEVSYAKVTGQLHPGAVMLLHSTSPDNVAILGRLIDYARENGYTFRSLDEYEHWT